MRNRLWTATMAALLVSFSAGAAVGQGAPWYLVQARDGTLHVITGDLRHRIVPVPISDAELAAIPEAEPWEGGTMASAAAAPPEADMPASELEDVPTAEAVIPPASSGPNKADAQPLDPRQLTAEPGAFVGWNIWLQGEAQNVTHHEATGSRPSYTWIQLLARVSGRTTTESIAVTITPKDPSILKDECYRFYGIGAGTTTVTRTLTGARDEVPHIRAYAWEPAPRERTRCASP